MKISQIKISTFILLFWILTSTQLKAQEPNIDSLRAYIATNPKDDTSKVNALNIIGRRLMAENKSDSAFNTINYCLKLAEQINYKKGMSYAYTSLGFFYSGKNNPPKALSNHFLSLKIKEEIGDKVGIAWTYFRIGDIYNQTQNNSDALKYTFKSLKIMREFGLKDGEIGCYTTIGISYNELKNYKEALKYFNMFLLKSKEIKDSIYIALAYVNIGDVYLRQKKYIECLKYQDSALTITQKTNDNYTTALAYLNKGICSMNINNLNEAEVFCFKGFNLGKELNEPVLMKDADKALSDFYTLKGDNKKAFDYYKDYIAIRDSLNNDENSKKTTELEMNFQFDKKEAVAKIEQEKKDEIQETKLYFAIFGVIFALMLMVIIFSGYKRKQKDNVLLIKQKEELNEKNRIIEEKQNEVLASMRYAKHIQISLMPTEKYIEKNLNRLKN